MLLANSQPSQATACQTASAAQVLFLGAMATRTACAIAAPDPGGTHGASRGVCCRHLEPPISVNAPGVHVYAGTPGGCCPRVMPDAARRRQTYWTVPRLVLSASSGFLERRRAASSSSLGTRAAPQDVCPCGVSRCLGQGLLLPQEARSTHAAGEHAQPSNRGLPPGYHRPHLQH